MDTIRWDDTDDGSSKFDWLHPGWRAIITPVRIIKCFFFLFPTTIVRGWGPLKKSAHDSTTGLNWSERSVVERRGLEFLMGVMHLDGGLGGLGSVGWRLR
jgi:hypothetical protein